MDVSRDIYLNFPVFSAIRAHTDSLYVQLLLNSQIIHGWRGVRVAAGYDPSPYPRSKFVLCLAFFPLKFVLIHLFQVMAIRGNISMWLN